MKLCYLDAFSGISGDMTVGALIDAGAPCEAVLHALRSFDTGARFSAEKTLRGGITATKFHVDTGSSGNAHRHLSHILELIEHSSISLRAKSSACAVFQRLGK